MRVKERILTPPPPPQINGLIEKYKNSETYAVRRCNLDLEKSFLQNEGVI